MILVGPSLCHKTCPICQKNIICGIFLFLMESYKVAIRCVLRTIEYSVMHNEYVSCMSVLTHWWGNSLQLSGRLIPGWGQAGQNTVSSPGPGSRSSCANPCHLRFFICRHCLDTLMSSRYRSYLSCKISNIRHLVGNSQVLYEEMSQM